MRKLAEYRRKKTRGTAKSLSNILPRLMEEKISVRYKQLTPVVCVWNQLLPAELRRQCKIAGIDKGILKVIASSASYASEFRLCSDEILAEIQYRCPRSRIRRIKIVLE